MEFDSTAIEQRMKELPAMEVAVFKLILHLHNLEQKKYESSEQRPILDFEYGRTSTQIIEDVIEGDTFSLPIPHSDRYAVFGWMMGFPYDPEEAKQFPSQKAYREAHLSVGSSDIRIFDYKDEVISEPCLKFFANMGSFKGMVGHWKEALDQINYPCFVEDRNGFRFENAAYQIQKSK